MVFVKVRETYDLHTTKNKMTVIGIHTPKPDIIKRNYPGLLMQCRAYRPVSADVRIACASIQPLDPKGVGLADGDVAPEDVFNPILYKAMSNKGMSQLEARIQLLCSDTPGATLDIAGSTANVEVDDVTNQSDEFPIYYGLLSNTHDWKHANPQAGLQMTDLRPFVYEMVYNMGDQRNHAIESPVQNIGTQPLEFDSPGSAIDYQPVQVQRILGNAKPMPFINCTAYSRTSNGGENQSGFDYTVSPGNCEVNVPWINVVCGCIIVPPSRLHELFYRMVVEWTIEFSQLRPIHEITDWYGLAQVGNQSHYQNYSYSATKEAITGDSSSIMDQDTCMVSSNVDINKVM